MLADCKPAKPACRPRFSSRCIRCDGIRWNDFPENENPLEGMSTVVAPTSIANCEEQAVTKLWLVLDNLSPTLTCQKSHSSLELQPHIPFHGCHWELNVIPKCTYQKSQDLKTNIKIAKNN